MSEKMIKLNIIFGMFDHGPIRDGKMEMLWLPNKDIPMTAQEQISANKKMDPDFKVLYEREQMDYGKITWPGDAVPHYATMHEKSEDHDWKIKKMLAAPYLDDEADK